MKKIIGLVCLLFTGNLVHAQYKVSGVVLDSATLEPLSNADVSLTHFYRSSDEKGQFNFPTLSPGNYTLYVNHVGCDQTHLNFNLRSDTFITIYLKHHVHEFDEVISYGHSEHKEPDAKALQRIDHVEIMQKGADQLSDVFAQVEGISFIRSGYNVSKPVIRGLHSTRIAIITSDAKLEGQQWGAEHAPEIDPITSGSIELIKGAGSLIYAGDAPGGMFRLIPSSFRDTSYSALDFLLKTELLSLTSAHVGLKAEHFNAEKGIGNRIGISVKKAGDASSPSYNLPNTAYQQLSATHYFSWKSKFATLELNTKLYMQDPGVLAASHIGNLSDLLNAYNSDTPLINRPFSFKIGTPYQKVRHYSSALSITKDITDRSELKLSLQSQYNHRREFDAHGGGDAAAIELQLYTQQLFAKLETHFNNRLKQQMGINLEEQSNLYNGMYFIPNYRRWKGGVFYLLTLERSDLLLEAGLRYDLQALNTFRRVNGEVLNDQFNYKAYSANISGWKSFGHDVKLHWDLGSYYKFPDINELFADGLHHASAMIEKGDMLLSPERTYSLSMGYLYNHNRWKIDLSPYVRRINDFIYLRPSGISELTIRGAFPVFEHTQTDAIFLGSDLNIRYLLSKRTFVRMKHMILYVRDLEKESYIYGMPPQRVQLDLEKHTKLSPHFSPAFGLSTSYTFKQEWADESTDFVPPPEGYLLLNFFATTTTNRPWHLRLEVNNLLNTTYRDYLNRYRYFANEVGTNFKITLNYNIK